MTRLRNIYIVHPGGTELSALAGARAIDKALRALDAPRAMRACVEIANKATTGFAHVADITSPSQDVRMAMMALEAAGYKVHVNVQDENVLAAEIAKGEELSPEEAFDAASGATAGWAPTETKTPEEQAGDVIAAQLKAGDYPVAAYKTAMAMLVMAEGNPLNAAAHARTLARTTGETDFYAETIGCLIHVFPWLATHMLEARNPS